MITEYTAYSLMAISIALIVGLPILYLRGWRMVLAMVSFMATLVMSVFLIFMLLGKPNYNNAITNLLYPELSSGQLDWFSIDPETRQIVILIQDMNHPRSLPVYLSIPYSDETAEQLQNSEKEQEKAMLGDKNGERPTAFIRGLTSPSGIDVRVFPPNKPLPKTEPTIRTFR